MARPKISELSDEDLASVGGMPGSIDECQRTMDFRRRSLKVQREVAAAQIAAATWTKRSAIAVGASVFVGALSLVFAK